MADDVRTRTLLILIRAQNFAEAQMAEAAGQAEVAGSRIATAFRAAGIAAGVLGIAAAGALAISVDQAVKFQAMTQKVADNTTMTTAGLQTMRSTILQMSADSGASLDQLATGFMHIQNLGFSVSDSITLLNQAMMSAVSTGSNVGDVANTLAFQMHDFGLNASQAGRAMDVLHLAAAEGNATLEQFVESTSKAVTTAANLGLSLTDTDAALAALSRHMDISQASTMLAGMLQKISGPSVSAKKELALLSKTSGVDLVADFSAAGLKARGLTGVLADLEKATGNNYTEIQKLIPATRGGMAALVLNGTAAKDYTDILAKLNETMAGQTQPTITAYAAYLSTAAGTQARVTAGLNVMSIEIGTALLPALTSLLDRILPIVQVMTTWVGKHPQLTAAILATVAAVGLLAGGLTILEMVAGPLVGILGAIGAPLIAIAAAGALLYEAWTHDWGGIQEKTQAVWAAVHPVFTAIGSAIQTLRAAFNTGGMSGLFSALPGAAAGVGDTLRVLGEQVSTAFVGAFRAINWPQVEAALIHGMVDVFHTMTAWLQNTGLPFLEDRLRDIGSAFSHIDWGAIGAAIVSGLARLKADFQSINWTNVWDTLKTAFTTTVAWIRSLNWGGWAQDAITGIQTALRTIAGWMAAGGTLIWQQAVHPWITALWNWIDQVTQPMRNALGRLLSNMLSWIESQPGNIKNHFERWATEFSAWVPNRGWPLLLAALTTLGQEVGKWIVLTSPPMIAAGMFIWVVKFHEWVLKDALPALLKDANTLLNDFTAWIRGGAGQAIEDAAKTWPLKIASALLTAHEAVYRATIQVAGIVMGALYDAYTLIYTAAASLISGLVQGMLSGTSSVLGAISRIIGVDMKTPFDNMVSWFHDMGANLVHGLISGIDSMAGSLAGAVKSKITGVLKDIPGVDLIMHSPSQVYHQFGVNIVEGLINGIASKSGALEAQMHALTAQVSSTTFAAAIAHLSVSASGNATSGATAAPFVGAGSVSPLGGIGQMTNTITVHVQTATGQVTTSGDQTGIGELVGQAIVSAFQRLDRAAQSSTSIAGHVSLGGAV